MCIRDSRCIRVSVGLPHELDIFAEEPEERREVGVALAILRKVLAGPAG